MKDWMVELKEKYNIVEIYKIQTEALLAIHEYLHQIGYLQLMPVIVSPITDPLSHPLYEAFIKYQNQKLQLTKSMALHKQIAIFALDVKGIYFVSPNVRLEKDIQSDNHLLEFSQLDIEMKDASASDFRSFMEDLIIYIFKRVRDRCKEELEILGVHIKIPEKPFRVYSSWDLRSEFGSDFESQTSKREHDLFWITDFEREFYDKEDENRRGYYFNYDLFYPEGFGEALSGGERDYEYEVIKRKLEERNQSEEDFISYLELSKAAMLGPSAGGGLGIERLIRFLTKRSHIGEITLFPKVPGESIFL
ncbi:MAG: asparagine synthetase A [Candidatus Thorarchaeota archaeon]|jgi:asparaginyl-tRNA synthetase